MSKSWYKAFKAWYAALKGLPGAIVTNLPQATRRIVRFSLKRLCACYRRVVLCIRRRCTGQVAPRHAPSHTPAVPINHPAFKKPDPMIYDQYYLMSLGLAVSWQNPDIQITLGGLPVASSYDLQPNTTYEIAATIWNGSTEGVASGMVVAFSYLSFGVCTESHFIGTKVVDLGVKGSKHCPAQVPAMAWTTPALPGHYCIQVSFAWIDDANPFNNLGQENTQVVLAASPAQFSFALGNPTRDRRPCRFEYDTYAIPAPPPCSEVLLSRGAARPVGAATVPATVAARHSRADYPLPAGWTLTFDPADPVVAPGAEIPILVTVTPPNTFHGSLPLNIHTFSGTELVGGVTVFVNRA